MNLTVHEVLMFSTLRIKAFNKCDDHAELGTGFLAAFCPSGNQFAPVLVTNRHILENHSVVEIPFTLKRQDGSPDIGNIKTVQFDASSQILHPNPAVDLAILPLGAGLAVLKESGTSLFYTLVNIDWIPTEDQWKNFDTIEQIVTVGFPKGFCDTTNNFPIFRSGTTATLPKYDFEGKPEFLIDVVCFQGCSGSPVYIINQNENREIPRICLLGIHRASVSTSFSGSLINAPEELTRVVPTFQMPMNLGVAIRSSELLALEAILQETISNQPAAHPM